MLDIVLSGFEGARGKRGLSFLTAHPHVIGHRSRIAVLPTLPSRASAHWAPSPEGAS